jgi:hypothetical protein
LPLRTASRPTAQIAHFAVAHIGAGDVRRFFKTTTHFDWRRTNRSARLENLYDESPLESPFIDVSRGVVSKRYVMKSLAAVLCCIALSLVAIPSSAALPRPAHVIVIVEENKTLAQIDRPGAATSRTRTA